MYAFLIGYWHCVGATWLIIAVQAIKEYLQLFKK
jgi:hypothetical protein